MLYSYFVKVLKIYQFFFLILIISFSFLDLLRNATLHIIAEHMGEDFSDLFVQNKNGYLKKSFFRGECEVYQAILEGVNVMSSNLMIECVMGLMAAYYIFNVGYPPKLKRTLLFIQMKVIGENDKKDNVMKSFYKKM